MNAKVRRSGRVEVAVPIQVRGMSTDNKFFDERTQTKLVSKHGLMTQLKNLLELETEVHVTNTENNIGGTFRVAWVNTRGHEGFHDVGLEIVETEGTLWKIYFPPLPPEENEPRAQAWLECQRCHQRRLTDVPETEYEFLCIGFLVARICDTCKATTPWEFRPEEEPAPPPSPGRLEDKRGKGRVPLKMPIKVTRRQYGGVVEDISQTENVSRSGAYFLSNQDYEVGERVKVILPYKVGDVALPLPARVVRVDPSRGTFRRGVAIHLEERE